MRGLIPGLLMLALTGASLAQTTADECPKSVVIAGQPYDLAGDIRAAGSAQALLAKIEQGLRELPANCSQFSNKYDCEATKIISRGVKAALDACLARVGTRPNAPPVVSPTTPSAGQSSLPSSTGVDDNVSLYNTDDNSDGNQVFRQMAAAGKPFTPRNPQQDHTGEPCVYFTKPLVRADGGGLNAYADGSYVAYGKFYYVCKNRRWTSIGLSSAFVNIHEHAAEKLESSALSTQIFEKD